MLNTKRTVIHQINDLMKCEGVDKGLVSDGFHSFDELYEHRSILYIQLCKALARERDEDVVWKSRLHSDGTMFEGWFVLGINTFPGEQITYHLPDSYWEDCWFASNRSKAPLFDGHTSDDVIKRLKQL